MHPLITRIGTLCGCSLGGKDGNHLTISLPGGQTEKIEDTGGTDTFWYYLRHRGHSVYETRCVKCQRSLWSLLYPVPFYPYGPVCKECLDPSGV
jgi:hypothetical protein